MRILVTGARGFVGRNLCASLASIRDGKDRRARYQPLLPLTVFEHDLGGTQEELSFYCSETDFVFNLAGVNRPKDASEFASGNAGFLEELIDLLEQHGNTCPVMLASSAQATLEGRYAGSEYGRSKLLAEGLLREHAERTGAKALIYRFPNLYGKWCRPNYNSAVATFCSNIANGLPVRVDDPATELELLYIDDLVTEMLEALLGNETHGADGFCHAGPTDRVTLGAIVERLEGFRDSRETLAVLDESAGSFSKKLHAAYLSYLDPASFSYGLDPKRDERGSFTEFLRTSDHGQVSVNVSKPGITKGNHWHHTKWEKFLVVSGDALVRLRRVGEAPDGGPFPTVEYRVSGAEPTVLEMPPGYAHSIENLSGTEDLVTVIWSNETFDPERPDTYYEEV